MTDEEIEINPDPGCKILSSETRTENGMEITYIIQGPADEPVQVKKSTKRSTKAKK